MKVLANIFSVVAVVSIVAGCASSKNSVYIPKIPPEVQALLLDYAEQPENKVFILAVDPGGDFACAYEYGKATLKEAAKLAVEQIDAQREANGVIGNPYIYALNDKVVWEEMIRDAHKDEAGAAESAPVEEESAEEAPVEEESAEEAPAPAAADEAAAPAAEEM